MRIEPAISGVEVVLLGDFNPAIFTPAWFAIFGSGLREIRGTFSRLREAPSKLTWAVANRVLFTAGPCQVWSLSRADDAFVGFLRELASLMPRAGQAETRVGSLSPNGVAVVLWIFALYAGRLRRYRR